MIKKYKWILAPLVTAIVTAATAWASWVTTNVESIKLDNAHFDGDLAVVNTKIDLLMGAFDVTYTGPAFHTHDQGKK